MVTLNRIAIEGYKSIENMDLSLRQMNVIIGANASGKSNFLSFFELLRAVVSDRLGFTVERAGGAHSLMYLGPKRTQRISGRTWFETTAGPKEYNFAVALGEGDRL